MNICSYAAVIQVALEANLLVGPYKGESLLRQNFLFRNVGPGLRTWVLGNLRSNFPQTPDAIQDDLQGALGILGMQDKYTPTLKYVSSRLASTKP
jgi:hypothetical protein